MAMGSNNGSVEAASQWVASAPGKVMLAGEYAVLYGGPAVVAAVNRRARARLGDVRRLHGFLAALKSILGSEFGRDSMAVSSADRLIVDTDELYDASGDKLGLGSSAAATVAATVCCLNAASISPSVSRVHNLAHRAHQLAQARRGHPGSGADVAASSYGGLVHFTPGQSPVVRPLTAPPPIVLEFVWTGRPASTVDMVATVTAAQTKYPGRFETLFQRMNDTVSQLEAAFTAQASADAIAALATAGDLAAQIGTAAEIPIETPLHRQLRALAEQHGGTAKSSGAGGGDIAIAAFCNATEAAAFRSDVQSRGWHALALELDYTPASTAAGHIQ